MTRGGRRSLATSIIALNARRLNAELRYVIESQHAIAHELQRTAQHLFKLAVRLPPLDYEFFRLQKLNGMYSELHRLRSQ